jgi:xanthine/uracil permease
MPMQLTAAAAGFALFSNWKVTKRVTPTLVLTISTGSGATVSATSNANYNLNGVLQSAFNSAIATGAVVGTSEL